MVTFLYTYVFPIINFAIFIWLLIYFGKKPFFLYGQDKKTAYEEMSLHSKKKYEIASEQHRETLERLGKLDLQLKAIESRWEGESREEEQKIAFSTQQAIKTLQEESKRICEQYKNKTIREIKAQIWKLAQEEVVKNIQQQQKQNKQDVVEQLSVWQAKSSLAKQVRSGEII
jgi:DNA phosphorothioation-dependent restriction protein DptG